MKPIRAAYAALCLVLVVLIVLTVLLLGVGGPQIVAACIRNVEAYARHVNSTSVEQQLMIVCKITETVVHRIQTAAIALHCFMLVSVVYILPWMQPWARSLAHLWTPRYRVWRFSLMVSAVTCVMLATVIAVGLWLLTINSSLFQTDHLSTYWTVSYFTEVLMMFMTITLIVSAFWVSEIHTWVQNHTIKQLTGSSSDTLRLSDSFSRIGESDDDGDDEEQVFPITAPPSNEDITDNAHKNE